MGRPELKCPAGASDTGAYQISWTGPKGGEFKLQEGDAVIYSGPATATTVSGREPGKFTYRVGARHHGTDRLIWSDPCVVRVEPPAIFTALILFLVGLGIFLSTLTVIIRGHRAREREDLLP